MDIRNGTSILHVADTGDESDRPVLLLLHGIISSGRTWAWIVPEVANRFRVLRLDFRGHGRSDRTPHEYMPADYVGDAVAVLKHVGRPCVVIGHSLGGGAAAALTQQRPDLVIGAIMEDPPLKPSTPSSDSASLETNYLLERLRLMRQSIPALQESNTSLQALVELLSAAPDAAGTATFGATLTPDALESMAAGLLAVDATVLDPVLDSTTYSFIDPAVGFGVPSLIIAADPSKPDAVADPRIAQDYADMSSDTEVVVVSGAGHLIHGEQASRAMFLTAVTSFLRRVAPC